MSGHAWPAGVAVAGAAVLLSAGCPLGDLFRPSGLKQVELTYEGPTTMAAGTRAAFSVTVVAGGVVLRESRLGLSLSNPVVLAFTAGLDSLIALQVGRDTLVAQLESSMVTDTVLTLVQEIRVTGGPGPVRGRAAPASRP